MATTKFKIKKSIKETKVINIDVRDLAMDVSDLICDYVFDRYPELDDISKDLFREIFKAITKELKKEGF